uniref:Carboxylic ester hydrolase n=2 Tax=Drosophila willistoni TaxID=7260 RepID=B4MQF3_DROWI
MKRLAYLGLRLCLFWTIVSTADLNVCLKDMGCLKGTLLRGYEESKDFEAFMGIPFGQPPIGDLRLKNPLPAMPWQGILDASVARDGCLQRNYFVHDWDVRGEEDCLYLNVYRPKAEKRGSESLPVMVYIHSGGFISGTAYPTVSGPEYLMDTEAIILVTINYRLGPFGFLSTGDEQMPGNFGLKDQRLALQWVQKHISSFGGDSNLVTIFGHSAGGISTHYHLLSENSKNLFQKAMSFSGTAFAAFMRILKDPLKQAQKLAEHLQIKDANILTTQELAKALRQVDAYALLYSGDILKTWDNQPIMNYRPVIEKPSPEAFFTEDPVESHLAGRIQQIPWLLGSTSRAGEGSIFLLRILDIPKWLKEFNDNFVERFALALNLPEGTSPQVVTEILNLYDVQVREFNNETLIRLAEIVGDFNFHYPLYVAAASYASYANLDDNPMSIYSYEYRGAKAFSVYFTQGIEYEVGSVHMDDCLHTLRTPVLIPDFPRDSEDATVMKRMTSLLVEFAKTGIFAKETSLKSCQANSFNMAENQICNYFRFGGVNGAYTENIDDHVDMRAMTIWKKLYL